jgi:hypothetical protein
MKLFREYFESKNEKILEFTNVSDKIRSQLKLLDLIRGSLFPDLSQFGG